MFGAVNRLSLSVDRLFSNGAEGFFHNVISANTMIGLYADYCHWNEIKNCRQNLSVAKFARFRFMKSGLYVKM